MLLGFLLSISIFAILITVVHEDRDLTLDFLNTSTVMLDYSTLTQ